jgi:hypothetical protein
LDAWSPLALTKWQFGDGGTASGMDVSHAYNGSGDYTITVSSSDALGNTSSASGTVRIEPTPTPSVTTPPAVTPSSVDESTGPPAPPTPQLCAGRNDGEAIGVTIEGSARYTNSPNVELTIRTPDAASGLYVSNDGGFNRPFTVPLQPSWRYRWSLDSSGPERLPKTVYVRFAGACVDSLQTFTDDIILDETAPTLRTPTAQAPAKGRSGSLTLSLKAVDNASGVSSVEVRRAKARVLAAKYKRRLRLNGSPEKLTVRVRDGAGNHSPWKKVKVVRNISKGT